MTEIKLPPLPNDDIAQRMTETEVRSLLKRYGQQCATAAIEAALQSQPMNSEVKKRPISNETKIRINRNITLIKRLIGNGASKALRDEADAVVSQLERLKEYGTSCTYTLQSQDREDAQPKLKVVVCSFPESNGKRNWTALLLREQPWEGLAGNCGGITLAYGELWNRVAYEAERTKFLLGMRDTEPFILDYSVDIETPEQWLGETIDRARRVEGEEK